jgi:Tfp pilus assembly protein PilZ
MSESDKRERRTHFRGKARPGRRVELAYRATGDDDSEPVRAFTRNIGVGGAFVVTDQPAPVGAKLHIMIDVPTSEQTIQVSAEVRWSSADSGMGVKFHDLDVDQLLQLSEYFASLTGSEAAL